MARTVPVENTGSDELALLEGRSVAVPFEGLDDVEASPVEATGPVPEGEAVPNEREWLNVPLVYGAEDADEAPLGLNRMVPYEEAVPRESRVRDVPLE